jgi:penicillin-binding protein 2B
MIQAMTTISNHGVMLKPYIVDKIVDSNTNEIMYQGTRTEVATVASEKTVNKMKDLMYDVIYKDSNYSTGSNFRMTGYDIIGKTGTAQYIDSSTGTYYTDSLNYIRSFVGMFPKDNPQYIIYTLMKKPYNGARGLTSIVKGLVKDISNYKGVYNSDVSEEVTSYQIDNYMNKDIDVVLPELDKKFSDVVVIGNGKKIISQYPSAGTTTSMTEKVYLVTNGSEKTMPDLTYWSLKEVSTFVKLANIKLQYEGSGYVYEQSIQPGTKINGTDKLIIKLKNKIESD